MTAYFYSSSCPKPPDSNHAACMARLWPKGRAKAMQVFIDKMFKAPKQAHSTHEEQSYELSI
ncbi:hypothetical protein [uncultured Cohaesibacter sp.]|uniref:hypothetical protein n=1 Tax=uncultured Cohaesibacter sp. TaxID=1002546 RepID=UPI002AAB301B|nr:hypothetical protein [uncultured Cohaesibacter sp.]